MKTIWLSIYTIAVSCWNALRDSCGRDDSIMSILWRNSLQNLMSLWWSIVRALRLWQVLACSSCRSCRDSFRDVTSFSISRIMMVALHLLLTPSLLTPQLFFASKTLGFPLARPFTLHVVAVGVAESGAERRVLSRLVVATVAEPDDRREAIADLHAHLLQTRCASDASWAACVPLFVLAIEQCKCTGSEHIAHVSRRLPFFPLKLQIEQSV